MARRWLTALLVAGLAAGAGYYFWQQRSTSKLDVQTVAATRADVRRIVSTSGTVRALGTVEIGSQLSGNIGELNADFSSEVKKGQVLARIEPSTFESKVREEEAGLAIAKANVALQEASVRRAEANLRKAEIDLGRADELLRKGRRRAGCVRHRDGGAAERHGRSWYRQGASRERRGHARAAPGHARQCPHRPRAHLHPRADRRRGDRAHGRSRADRGREPDGAQALHHGPGFVTGADRGAGRRGRYRPSDERQSRDLHRRRLSRRDLQGRGRADQARSDRAEQCRHLYGGDRRREPSRTAASRHDGQCRDRHRRA